MKKNTSLKKICFLIITIFILCIALVGCDEETYTKEVKTIDIYNVEDLQSLNNYLGDEYSLYTFELRDNINLSDIEWEPIGRDNENSFKGTFNGNGYTISNMSIVGMEYNQYTKSINYSNAGLFGYVYNASIKDLNLTSSKISYFLENDYSHIGLLIGYCYGNTSIENVEINGTINLGTSYYLQQRTNLKEITCEQTEYVGGIIGYSSGNFNFNSSISDVEKNNLMASRGPKYDRVNEDYVYIKDENGNNTSKIEYEVIGIQGKQECYPIEAFVGGAIGLVKGNDVIINNISSTSILPVVYSVSAYVGGVFGAVYHSNINQVDYSGSLGTNIYTKAVAGGIAGIIDETRCNNVLVEDTEITCLITRDNYQAYSIGGLIGYANDFSMLQSGEVNNTKILSNLKNIKSADSIDNYPAIGGLVGTSRDSDLTNCHANGGGVYKRDGVTPVDNTYIYTAGMIAIVLGNSNIESCYSSFFAYCGAISRYNENIYVDSKGKRILRFCKKDNPKVYIGINSYEENGVLKCQVLDEAGDELEIFEYKQFTGNSIETYINNFYDSNLSRLIKENDSTMVVGENNRELIDYELLTGMYSFVNLKYDINSVVQTGECDINLGEGIYQFVS